MDTTHVKTLGDKLAEASKPLSRTELAAAQRADQIRALEHEREGYQRAGKHDRVASVDAELDRLRQQRNVGQSSGLPDDPDTLDGLAQLVTLFERIGAPLTDEQVQALIAADLSAIVDELDPDDQDLADPHAPAEPAQPVPAPPAVEVPVAPANPEPVVTPEPDPEPEASGTARSPEAVEPVKQPVTPEPDAPVEPAKQPTAAEKRAARRSQGR